MLFGHDMGHDMGLTRADVKASAGYDTSETPTEINID